MKVHPGVSQPLQDDIELGNPSDEVLVAHDILVTRDKERSGGKFFSMLCFFLHRCQSGEPRLESGLLFFSLSCSYSSYEAVQS